ncbi:NfeD family protein [Vagococcus fluvialis]|uniref:NfeD family protein n=1 Tax=Vagococcus TaxID=2737 RepID=UPI003B5923E6
MIEGYPIDTVYLYVLIGCTVISIFLFIFGDIFDFDGPIDPMLIIPWLAFTSLFGIVGEKFFDFSSLVILLASGGLSTIIVFLMNFYILVPLRNSESSLSVSEKDIEGRTATVITPIPFQGMGEIKISSVTGSMTRPASYYEAQEVEVKAGDEVLIIEIKDRVCYVVPYKENFV